MSKKMADFENIILPLFHGLVRSGLDNQPLIQALVNNCFSSLKGIMPNYSSKITVVEIDEQTAYTLKNEMNLETFSFNIKFDESCTPYKCYEQWFVPDAGGNRITIPVYENRTPAFMLFHYKGIPLIGICLYATSMNTWADMVGLRKSMFKRTDNPSTHFVNTKHAFEESGLFWMNKTVLSSLEKFL